MDRCLSPPTAEASLTLQRIYGSELTCIPFQPHIAWKQILFHSTKPALHTAVVIQGNEDVFGHPQLHWQRIRYDYVVKSLAADEIGGKLLACLTTSSGAAQYDLDSNDKELYISKANEMNTQTGLTGSIVKKRCGISRSVRRGQKAHQRSSQCHSWAPSYPPEL